MEELHTFLDICEFHARLARLLSIDGYSTYRIIPGNTSWTPVEPGQKVTGGSTTASEPSCMRRWQPTILVLDARHAPRKRVGQRTAQKDPVPAGESGAGAAAADRATEQQR